MRGRTALRRASGATLALALAALMLPFDTTPADAGRIKVRVRSSHSAANKVDEHQTARPDSPLRMRIRSGSSSSAADTRDDQKARPRAPSAAAAAAARARAALEAEKAAQAAKGVAAVVAAPQALPTAKTTDYGNGVTCIAGC